MSNITKVEVTPIEPHASCPPWCVSHTVEVLHGAIDYRQAFAALAAASPALGETLTQLAEDPATGESAASVLHQSQNFTHAAPGVSIRLQRTDAITPDHVHQSPEVAVLSMPYFGDVLLTLQNADSLARGLQAAVNAFTGVTPVAVLSSLPSQRPGAHWYGSIKRGFCGKWSPTGTSQCMGKPDHRDYEHHSLSEDWTTAGIIHVPQGVVR